DSELQVHYNPGLAFAVEAAMAEPALLSLLESRVAPQRLLLLAGEQPPVDRLYQLLPPILRAELTELDIELRTGGRWDSMALDRYDSLDLRQGDFARQLPLAKWAREWRRVGVVAAVALLAYVGVNVAQIQVFGAQTAELRGQINE